MAGIHCHVTPKDLTSYEAEIEYREIRADQSLNISMTATLPDL
jgi:hypothetical protein